MKAERRHELQQNSLDRFMTNLPVMLRLYADRILLVIVLILLVVVLINWRVNANRQRVESAGESLTAARLDITRITLGGAAMTAEQVGQFRSQAERELENAVDNAASNDDRLRSQALLARGDLFWALANTPAAIAAAPTQNPSSQNPPSLVAPSSPTTGPSTSPSDPTSAAAADFLKQAESAYDQVLQSAAGADTRASALFGLGAIDENRRDFDAARRRYEQVLAMKDAPQSFRDVAANRMSKLDQIRQPLLIGQLTHKPEPLNPLVNAPTTASSPATAVAPPPTAVAQPTAVAPTTAPSTTQPAATAPAR